MHLLSLAICEHMKDGSIPGGGGGKGCACIGMCGLSGVGMGGGGPAGGLGPGMLPIEGWGPVNKQSRFQRIAMPMLSEASMLASGHPYISSE